MRIRLIIVLMLSLAVQGLQAKPTRQEQDPAKESARLMNQANRLLRQKDYLQAMDSATLALSLWGDNQEAKLFIYRQWDKMSKQANQLITDNTETNDLDQSRVRLNTYRLLMEINDNLRNCHMPIHGSYDRWVWQPELQYWDGHYMEEKARVKQLEKIQQEQQAAMQQEKELPNAQ